MKKNILLISMLICSVLFSSSVIASILTIRPNSQGSYSEWYNFGCSSGTDEWNCVEEAPANNSDYLYSGSSNQRESFNFEDVNLGSESIYGIELFYNAKKYSSTRYVVWPLLKINNAEFTGKLFSTGTNYAVKSQWFNKNPITNNPWTVSEINNLEAGMKLLNYVFAGVYVSQMYIDVDYDAPNVYPDLVVLNLTFQEYKTTNGTAEVPKVFVNTMISNVGLDTADVSTTRLQGLAISDRSTLLIRPGKSQFFSWNYDCTEPHNFTAIADSNGVIAEANKENNIKKVYIDCIV